MKPIQPLALICTILAFSALPLLAQDTAPPPQPCPLPQNVKLAPANNIFSPEQELELGDIEAQNAEHENHIIDDPALTAYVNQVAQRIAAQLPPNELHFQVLLYDSPEANAFSIAGGRIYISRRLIAFVKSEDELASLIGHEMGHSLSHQQASDYSYLFDKVLGVKQVTTRDDITEKYNQLLDNAHRKPEAFERLELHEEPDQYIADRVSLYAIANAGYSPNALLEFWDRFAETHGKGGSTLSAIFGISSTSQVRLGEMKRSLAALPPNCKSQQHVADPDFLAWQSAVVAFSATGSKEALTGVLSRKTLNPPLRGDLKSLRFSPDGKYILAQDEASIYVLTHEPLKELFRFDASDAHGAVFTPDSKDVVFLTVGLRAEKWDVSTHQRVWAHEIVNASGCNTTAISPDGRYVGCLGNNLTLYLYDVESGNAIFTRKNFVVFSFQEAFAELVNDLLSFGTLEHARMAFSPDGHYFLAAHASDPVGIDLTTGKPIPLHSSLHGFPWAAVAFLSPDTVVIENADNPADSVIAKFPSGQKVEKLTLGGNRLRSSAEGTYVFLSPLRDGTVGALDLKTKTLPVVMKMSPALDIYGSQAVLEGLTGQVGLMTVADRKITEKADLSIGPIGRLRAGAVSDDFKWLAVSGETRGAVWNLGDMNRLYFLHGFRGAYFDGDAAMFAQFPERGDTKATVARANLSKAEVTKGIALENDEHTLQSGAYLVTSDYADAKGHDGVILKVRDVRTGNELWSAPFKSSPGRHTDGLNNRIILNWWLDSDVAKDAAKADPGFAARRNAIRNRNYGELIQVRELSTGKILGSVAVDTGKGSFKVEDAAAVGDWLFVEVDGGRTLAYSLSSGELKGTLFGESPIASVDAGLLALTPSDGQVQFYSLPDFKKLSRSVFGSRVAMLHFSADGSRIFVLTRDQNTYVFDSKVVASSTTAPAPAATASLAASTSAVK